MTSADRLPSFVEDSGFATPNLASPNLASPDFTPSHLAARIGSMDTANYSELQERLGLYQVFLRLYENHRDLLDEILNLENTDNQAVGRITAPYIQGMVMGNQISLITNLIHGKTQATTQPQNTWLIGRDPCRVTLALSDRRLSRCHAALQYVEDQGFYLIDLRSSNGSFINSELIRRPTLLKDGDRIRLGSLTFSFFLCQSHHAFQPVNPDLLANMNGCTPLTPFAQIPTQAERLESAKNSPLEKGATPNPLEDTYSFVRQWQGSDG